MTDCNTHFRRDADVPCSKNGCINEHLSSHWPQLLNGGQSSSPYTEKHASHISLRKRTCSIHRGTIPYPHPTTALFFYSHFILRWLAEFFNVAFNPYMICACKGARITHHELDEHFNKDNQKDADGKISVSGCLPSK